MADEVPDAAQDAASDEKDGTPEAQDAAPEAQDAPDVQRAAPEAEDAGPGAHGVGPEEENVVKSAVTFEEKKKRPKVAWSDDLSHDSEEDRGNKLRCLCKNNNSVPKNNEIDF